MESTQNINSHGESLEHMPELNYLGNPKCRTNFENPPKTLDSSNYTKDKVLNVTNFKETISEWFKEHGFQEMRSFFRASVLNSVLKGMISQPQLNCTEINVVIYILIAEHLHKNGNAFTMSVYVNEVLKPLVKCSPFVEGLITRMNDAEFTNSPLLESKEISLILSCLNLSSLLSGSIVQMYRKHPSLSLMHCVLDFFKESVESGLWAECSTRESELKPNRPLQKDDFQECYSAMDKHFQSSTNKLQQMYGGQTGDGNYSFQPLNEPPGMDKWRSMDVYLKWQSQALMKERDDEREQLIKYAKELDDIRKLINDKLKSIQEYERKQKKMENKLRKNDNNLIERSERQINLYEPKRSVRDSKDVSIQCSLNDLVEYDIDPSIVQNVVYENSELKAMIREQQLRIGVLTKQLAAVSYLVTTYETQHSEPQKFHKPSRLTKKPVQSRAVVNQFMAGDRLVRKAKCELLTLKEERDNLDSQYNELLKDKLVRK